MLTSKDPNGTVSFIEGLFSIRGNLRRHRHLSWMMEVAEKAVVLSEATTLCKREAGENKPA